MLISEMEKLLRPLECLGAVDNGAIVAGGFPRDVLLDREPSDVDVFISCHKGETLRSIKRRLSFAGFPLTDSQILFGENIPLDYQLNPNIRFVATTRVEGIPYKVQIICLFEPDYHLIQGFPVSISQCYYRVGSGSICTTSAFEWTREHKVITLENQLYAKGHTYLEKIEKKFSPEYSMFWNRFKTYKGGHYA